MHPAQKTKRAAAAAVVFHALADPTRRRLLDLLASGDLPANSLARPFRMSRPAVSQHLRVLRRAGLVSVRRDGRQRYYRLRARRLRPAFDWLAYYERFWNEKLAALGDYLEKTP